MQINWKDELEIRAMLHSGFPTPQEPKPTCDEAARATMRELSLAFQLDEFRERESFWRVSAITLAAIVLTWTVIMIGWGR